MRHRPRLNIGGKTHNAGLKSLHWLKVEQRIQYKLISLTYSSLQHNSPRALSSATAYHTNQPTTGQPVLHQLALFSSHLSNWKLESVHLLLQRHFYGTLFQRRYASPLLTIYPVVELRGARGGPAPYFVFRPPYLS